MPYKDKEKSKKYHSRYMREVWYPKNRSKHITAVKKLKKKLQKFINDFKIQRSCVDCGFSGSPYPHVLDFDHIKEKKFDVASYSQHILSIKTLQAEINNCELVCANCHRIRTHNRRILKSKLDLNNENKMKSSLH